MANFLQMFRKTDKGRKDPLDFSTIDEEICKHMGVEPDDNKYHCGWYDFIGSVIAAGHPIGSAELRERIDFYQWDDLTRVLDFIEENYIDNSWFGR